MWREYVREDLKEKYIQKLPELVKRPKNKQKGSLEESCESLIVGTADGREERRRRRKQSIGAPSLTKPRSNSVVFRRLYRNETRRVFVYKSFQVRCTKSARLVGQNPKLFNYRQSELPNRPSTI